MGLIQTSFSTCTVDMEMILSMDSRISSDTTCGSSSDDGQQTSQMLRSRPKVQQSEGRQSRLFPICGSWCNPNTTDSPPVTITCTLGRDDAWHPRVFVTRSMHSSMYSLEELSIVLSFASTLYLLSIVQGAPHFSASNAPPRPSYTS